MIEQTKSEKTKIISVSVPQYMDDWLKEHTSVNRSLICQRAFYDLIYPQVKKVPLQTTLMCIMSIIAGICITLIFSIATIQIIVGLYFSIALMVLGIALAMSSFLVFKQARKEIRNVNA